MSKTMLSTTLHIVTNSLGFTVFNPRANEVGHIQSFHIKNRFWSTLEAPKEKTVYLQELVMIFKVVVNNIFDIHFEQNTVQSNLKEL